MVLLFYTTLLSSYSRTNHGITILYHPALLVQSDKSWYYYFIPPCSPRTVGQIMLYYFIPPCSLVDYLLVQSDKSWYYYFIPPCSPRTVGQIMVLLFYTTLLSSYSRTNHALLFYTTLLSSYSRTNHGIIILYHAHQC